MSAVAAILLLVFVDVLAPHMATTDAPPQQIAEEPGVTGYVLAPDGTPVSSGTVVAQSALVSTTVSIDSAGRFRFVPIRSGFLQVLVSVPGLVPYRLTAIVPDSKSLRLPVIRLASGPYFRVRLVSAAVEPIIAPQLRRRMFDVSGTPISDALGDRIGDPIDNDGAITIGPLPRGIMTMAVDMPLFAQTRLPDVNVGDAAKTILDAGTIAIQQPGAVLHVNVLDGTGAPVPTHDVHIEDARPRSPLSFRSGRTDQQGRATFDRLAAGRYRVSTTATDRCAGVVLATSRVVPLPDNGTVEIPLMVGGRATFHITSPLGPARGVPISASPNSPAQSPSPFPFLRPSSGCRGATDADGRVTLTNFPPGPAHVDVHLANSTFVRQVEVPSDQREVAVAIPDGFLPVRVVSALNTNQALAGATITWTGSGGRVEATATAAGEALLEGVGTAGGTLAVEARGYQPAEEQLTEPPGVPHTIALRPLPPATNLRARVSTTSGEPLPNASVELISTNTAAVPHVAVTNANGVVTFSDMKSGSLQLIASADRFVTSTMRIGNRSGEVVFTLSRGYRVLASVRGPPAGPQVVRVLNDSNESMDSVLDSESDRRLEPPGRLSLGPLAPGAYVIELQGASGRRIEHVRIVDRDVYATFR